MIHVSVRDLPPFARLSPLLVVALAVGWAMIPATSSSTRAIVHPVAQRASTVQGCGSRIVPTSPRAREVDLRRVAQKRLRDSVELTRQQRMLSRVQRQPLQVNHNSIRHAKYTIRQLKRELACLSNRVAATLSIAVSGNHLVDGVGKVVTLHGVNLNRTQWGCLFGHAFESPTDGASIAAMVAWHINAVRIPLNEDCWLGINGAPTDIKAYHKAVRAYVDRLHSQGLYAILDLHWSAPGATLSHLGVGFNGFYEMADESHAPVFWESLASYFESDHAVLFDLFNEPFGISWSCWREGCMAPRGFQTAGMQQLVDVVRKTGATEPVMVGGLEKENQLGQEWLDNRPTDPANQMAASVHIYSQTNVALFNKNVGVVAAQFPVVTGETGDVNCVENDFNAFLPWADEHGVSYLAWAWNTGECASYLSLISDYSGTPTAYGIGYREHLLKNFPAPIP